MKLINSTTFNRTNSSYWLLTPMILNNAGSFYNTINSSGGYSWSNINGSSDVRPVLSLKYGVESTIDDGYCNVEVNLKKFKISFLNFFFLFFFIIIKEIMYIIIIKNIDNMLII